MADIQKCYPAVPMTDDDDLMDYLFRVVEATQQPFFFIIDEWDAICREFNAGTKAMDDYVNWLRRLFKSGRSSDVFAGAYLTGILPIKKYKTESALNNFIEYSMVEPGNMGQFFGFTKDEVRTLAEKHGMDFDELVKWYDGYQIGDEMSMFNPNSVMQAIGRRRCRSYWASTGAFDAVAHYIQMNYEGLKDDIVQMLAGGRCKVNPTKFQNDMSIIRSKDDVLTVLIHLGYLSYDWRKDECYIPNKEVAGEMVNAMEANELKRLPRGIQTFSEIREGNYLYVDKTELVFRLANDNKYVFMSRPRRFGKSVLCSTLKSYFEGRRDLFEGLAMEKLETEWKKHPVLLISLAPMKGGTTESFNAKIDIQLSRYEEQYGLAKPSDDPGARFQNLIEKLPAITKEKCVVILDEYDAPLLAVLHEPEKLKEMRTCVRSFFSCLKDCDPYLRFVFITGISKFSQVSTFSEINNLDKVTMEPRYSTICGITQEELETQMRPWVEHLAQDLGISVEETLRRLKYNYDGYHFARDKKDIYNPYSLLQALSWSDLRDYWFDTGTPSSLVNMLLTFGTRVTNFDDGCQCEAGEFDAPTEKMTTPMPFFYQSGYLTIKDYDSDMDSYTLKYPNKEVRAGMINALIPYYVEGNTINAKSIVADVYRAIRRDNLDEALQTLKVYLASIPYAENATSEGHYQTMLYVVFSLLGRYVQMEVRTAKGRIDMVFETKTDRYVMELKIDRPAQEALDQIDQNGYLLPYTRDSLRLHKVGISFSTKERTLTEWKITEE